MSRLVHWERPLSDGGLEIFVKAGTGRSFRVLAWPAHDARHLRDLWQQHTGITLPEPEVKSKRPTPPNPKPPVRTP